MLISKETKRRSGEPVNETDHLTLHANRLLVIAGRGAWRMAKFLVGVAVRIPGWFVRMNRRHTSGPDG
ncbi:MAG TPA: hypothetical protein VFE32_02690 [Puia sp.]|jgi:hypothetical protein|nr:hypothetical protein [Puia sp.]